MPDWMTDLENEGTDEIQRFGFDHIPNRWNTPSNIPDMHVTADQAVDQNIADGYARRGSVKSEKTYVNGIEKGRSTESNDVGATTANTTMLTESKRSCVGIVFLVLTVAMFAYIIAKILY